MIKSRWNGLARPVLSPAERPVVSASIIASLGAAQMCMSIQRCYYWLLMIDEDVLLDKPLKAAI